MAVLVEGISVIVRMDRLHACFGDWKSFESIVPNHTLCADGELVRVGFMAPDDAEGFCSSLERWGLHYLMEGEARDLVVVDQLHGLAASCDWVSFGHINWKGDPKLRVAACMLKGSAHNQLYTPDGWSYDGSLTGSYGFIPTDAPPTMLRVANNEGLETWITPLSSNPYYVGRTVNSTTGGVGSREDAKKARSLTAISENSGYAAFVDAYSAGQVILVDANACGFLLKSRFVSKRHALKIANLRAATFLLLVLGVVLFFFTKWYIATGVLLCGVGLARLPHKLAATAILKSALIYPEMYNIANERRAFRFLENGAAPKSSREYEFDATRAL